MTSQSTNGYYKATRHITEEAMTSMYDALNGATASWTTIDDIGDIDPLTVNPDEFRCLTLRPFLPKCNLQFLLFHFHLFLWRN